MRRACAALVFLLCIPPLHAAGTTTWMTVMLDGRKVGKMRTEREVTDKGVVTSQVADFRLTRGTTSLPSISETVATESSTGAPLAFHVRMSSSSDDNIVDGRRRDDGNFQLERTVGNATRVSLLSLPSDAMLIEGQRLAIVAHGFNPGTHYTIHNFAPLSQQVATSEMEVIGDERVDLPLGRETLHHLKQGMTAGNDTQVVDVWVDDLGNMRRAIVPLLGFRMETAVCDEACAKAPDQDVDLLRAAMISSPRPIPAATRVSPMRYTIAITGSGSNPLIDTDEQRVSTIGDHLYQLDIGAPQPHEDGGPTPEDLAPNPWVQSEAPEVVDMAKQAVGNADNDLQRMRRLRGFVSDYIEERGLDVGYASALETIRTRHGDCTEHAVLLAALARAQGVPTRVVTGLVYVERFAGASRVFVPHAWVQSWIDGRWMSFDSAERRFDATHIALGTGSGVPWRFFSTMNVLDRIHIRQAIASASTMDMPPQTPNMSPFTNPGSMSNDNHH